jgi:hypothetical protein
VVDRTVPEEPRKQRECVLCHHKIDIWLLSLKRLNRAAAWTVVCIERRFQ